MHSPVKQIPFCCSFEGNPNNLICHLMPIDDMLVLDWMLLEQFWSLKATPKTYSINKYQIRIHCNKTPIL